MALKWAFSATTLLAMVIPFIDTRCQPEKPRLAWWTRRVRAEAAGGVLAAILPALLEDDLLFSSNQQLTYSLERQPLQANSSINSTRRLVNGIDGRLREGI